ncbi:hypothetical protein Fmac_018649 [Flemingia macrophylla]|uniref:Pectinesterase inhibitor domain-containing protein n=1 Tax=Flemingia macrophylla TaxID=520843 RepID=A0ABD1M6A1_9FABA
MTFFVNMHGVIVLLLLLILRPPFIHQAQHFAVADDKLIKTLCHDSETPETCLKCVQSCNNSAKADGVIGIATMVVDCIKDTANNLALNITNLACTSQGELKSAYESCAKDYGDHIAKKELRLSKKALKQHKYDKAESLVVNALSFHLKCRMSLEHCKAQVPVGVSYDMKIYEELTEAASRIIEKL